VALLNAPAINYKQIGITNQDDRHMISLGTSLDNIIVKPADNFGQQPGRLKFNRPE
jgi:hypothetical protein